MDILTVLSIAVGLSMDALAVSITSGVAIKGLRPAHALKIAFFFGGFQAMMPVIGWLVGLIGLVTFALSFAGVLVGKRVGHLFGKKVEIAGGLILIGIGCKILLEHL